MPIKREIHVCFPLDSYLIRPFTLRDVSRVDPSIQLNLTSNGHSFAETLAFPLGIAPTAFQCMAHPDGEKATARGMFLSLDLINGLICANYSAAAFTGTIMICSSFSNFSFEQIAKSLPEASALLWFQVIILI
jgi:(S)-2-hydroxy-acid oxidase